MILLSFNLWVGVCVQVCFEYEAKQVEVVESLWTFCMDTLSLSVPFLLVGITREPLVYLDRAHLDFGELPVGGWKEGSRCKFSHFLFQYRFNSKKEKTFIQIVLFE